MHSHVIYACLSASTQAEFIYCGPARANYFSLNVFQFLKQPLEWTARYLGDYLPNPIPYLHQQSMCFASAGCHKHAIQRARTHTHTHCNHRNQEGPRHPSSTSAMTYACWNREASKGDRTGWWLAARGCKGQSRWIGPRRGQDWRQQCMLCPIPPSCAWSANTGQHGLAWVF